MGKYINAPEGFVEKVRYIDLGNTVKAAVYTSERCRAFADMMKNNRYGTMINISSVCARHCWPTWSVYAAAKAGVLNFSKGMYLEMQPYGVRVSCVVPSSASTGFQSACGIGETTDKLLPEDIAETVLYIANLPARAVVEDVTVWGIDKEINPL